MFLQDQELYVFLLLEIPVVQMTVDYLIVAGGGSVEVEVIRQQQVDLVVLDFLILSDVLLLQSCHL